MVKLFNPLCSDISPMRVSISQPFTDSTGEDDSDLQTVGRQSAFSMIGVLLNDVGTTFNPDDAPISTSLLSPALINDSSTHTPSPNPSCQSAASHKNALVSPSKVPLPEERTTPSTHKYPKTRRGDRLKMARTALETWRSTHWRDRYTDPDVGPKILLPDCVLRKLATKACLRTVAQIKTATRWDWAEDYTSEIMKVLDNSDFLWRVKQDLAIKERKVNRAKLSAQNKLIRDEQRRQEKYIERRLRGAGKPEPSAGLADGNTIGFPPTPQPAVTPVPYTLPPYPAYPHVASPSVPIPQMTDPAYPHLLPTYGTQDPSAASYPASPPPSTTGRYPSTGYYWTCGWVPMSMPMPVPAYARSENYDRHE